MRRAAILLGVAAALLAGAAGAEPFRIAASGPTAPCAPLASAAPAGEKAYVDHLAKRLERPVEVCAFATPAEAAAALAQGNADMARLDPASYAAGGGQLRAILTVRGKAESNRIPIVVATKGASAVDVAALKGKTIAFGGASPAGLATPQTVLSDRGLAPADYRAKVEGDGDTALAELRAGKVDAVAVHGAAWQRVCRMVSPKDPEPCKDLHIVLRARPEATQALVVRRDMPMELRFRLIGVHMALHLEDPAAFAYAAGWSKDPAEFQPAEAEALTLAQLK